MTELLEQAMNHLKTLPEEKQDAIAEGRSETIATLVMEELEDEAKWDSAVANSQDALAELAAEAMAER